MTYDPHATDYRQALAHLSKDDDAVRAMAGQDKDPLARLKAFSEAAEHAQAHVRWAANEARSQGATWTAIGQALGISRQAAQERFQRFQRLVAVPQQESTRP